MSKILRQEQALLSRLNSALLTGRGIERARAALQKFYAGVL